MGNYIKLQLENILTEGQTIAPEYCDKSYDRGLCDAIEEYEKLNLKYIESQAYGSWMDGAR